MNDYLRGMRTSIRGNAVAYAYSVMITCTFGILSSDEVPVSTTRVVLFALGAAVAFTSVEAIGSNFFRDRSRGEPAEVVVLGSAMSLFSITVAIGAAATLVWLLRGWPTWFLAPAGATVVYLAVSALEMDLARRAEEPR